MGRRTSQLRACPIQSRGQFCGPNGGYIGNCVGGGYYTEDEDLGDYPVFIDPLLIERTADVATSYWYISDAVEYVMATYDGDEYATWPTFDTLEDLLNAKYPMAGSGVFDPADAQTADISSVITTPRTSASPSFSRT